MYRLSTLIAVTLLSAVRGQHIGTQTSEVHPTLKVAQCTSTGCVTSTLSVVLDASWRWTHDISTTTNCFTPGTGWNPTLCPDSATCAANCAVDGVNYASYGISTSTDSSTGLGTLSMTLANSQTRNNPSLKAGSRVFLLDTNGNYKQLSLLGQEFTFDVDVSGLPCGVNGGVHLSAMAANGGGSQNTAGAAYGNGYCSAQCPQDVNWINGLPNVNGWSASAGTGSTGSCCPEVNVFDGNTAATSLSAHPCSVTVPTSCTGTNCGDGDDYYNGLCDKDGGDINPYRLGAQSFYGLGLTLDTTKKFTVVTQFVSSGGALASIKRFYVQSGVIFNTPDSSIPGVPSGSVISDSFVASEKAVFGETNEFAAKGGIAAVSSALADLTLALSILDDPVADLQWLDGAYPVGDDTSIPGVVRGSCSSTSGVPANVLANSPNAQVIFSNIKWGTFGSTYTTPVTTTTTSKTSTTSTTTTTTSTTTTTTSSTSSTKSSSSASSSPSPVAAHYAQCGGIGWTGATGCASGSTCTAVAPPYYYECL